jgi:PAS domain S-box-containing protein
MKRKILVIDDEESIRFTFKTFLSNEGHEVLTAEDYTSALEVISRNDLDLIFVDIILKEQSGIDILREVKARGLRCPVIIITGVPNIETASESVRLGAFDYLPKPVRKEALLHLTSVALQQKSLLDEKTIIETENEKNRCNLEAIFKSVKDAIITVDSDMHVIEANEATENICGISAGEITGKKFSGVLNKCDKTCHKVLQDTLKTKNTVKEFCIECRHQDRPRQSVTLSSSPLIDRHNSFKGAVLVIRDITRITDLEQELRERHHFQNIIGKSRKMQDIYRFLEHLIDTETTVLITGESGTGKELVAEALHYSGIRTTQPFIKVNCSALSENLLESELFGHVKGAFTGAVKDKVGRFQVANGGTILLDEIGDISPRIQLKLLRVLQEKEFEQVGDSKPVKVDVRIIAATNCDLREKITCGEFREDLYYRLNVVEVKIPPLRERLEDIPLLLDHFFNVFNKKFKKNIRGMSDEVLKTFMHYHWPGNIRELEHAIEHAFILCHEKIIVLEHLPAEVKECGKIKSPVPEKSSNDDAKDILQALNKTDWNKAKAARLLGMDRRTIYRKIDKHKLTKPSP